MIKSNDNSKEKTRVYLLILAAVIIVGIYQFYLTNKIDDVGVYTKCTVTNSEGYKGGIIITIKYKYKGHVYEGRMNSELGKGAIGNQYFIKILPENIEAVNFLRDNPVPDCLLNIEPPYKGWKEIPKCSQS